MNIKKLKDRPEYSGMILFVAFLVIYFIVQFISDSDSFFTVKTYKNFATLFKSFTPLILVTMAQALLMFMGIIDISIGILMSFANVLAVVLPSYLNIPIVIAWPLVIIIVIGLSCINGLIVSYVRIPPLLESFAMIFVIKGINLLIMPKPGGKVPTIANKIYDNMLFGFIPFSILIVIACYFIWKYISKTVLGRDIFAIGGNEKSAFATGINIEMTKIKVYAISGLFVALAGLSYTSAYTTGNPITGEIYGLQSISACIIGGIALSGGVGNMLCALYGVGFSLLVQTSVPKVFSMISKQTGMVFTTYWHNLLSDVIILIGLVVALLVFNKNRRSLGTGLMKQFRRNNTDEKQ